METQFLTINGLDFQFLEDGILDFENGIVGDVTRSKNPLFGNDISLSSTLNQHDHDDLLASSGPFEVVLQGLSGEDKQAEKSPWHESDSGLSSTSSFMGSPHSYTYTQQDQEVQNDVVESEGVEFINVDDLDFDMDCVQLRSTSLPTVLSNQVQDGNESPTNSNSEITQRIDLIEAQNRLDLEYFQSNDLFCSGPRKVRVGKVLTAKESSESTPQSCLDDSDKSRKNAVQAKINREKKKAYIKSLEGEISTLRCDNSRLKSENTKMHSSVTELEEEVNYLKSVLMNSSSLSNLLKNIPDVKEVNLSATIIGRKRSAEDHSYNLVESVSAKTKRARRLDENLKKAGVCLHVIGGSACLEFCAHCSKLAKASCAK